MKSLAGWTGIIAVSWFVIAFVVIGLMTPGFAWGTDYLSCLGSQGAPLAVWWNVLGFGLVGTALAVFGWAYGAVHHDWLLSACFLVAGVGFAIGAIPADLTNENDSMTAAHTASICLSLAGWCLGLARLGIIAKSDASVVTTANWAAGLIALPVISLGVGAIAPPIGHRLVLIVVFGWVFVVSLRLLKDEVVQAGDEVSVTQ